MVIRKIALATGGVRGIGKANSLNLLQVGYTVVANGVSNKSLPADLKDEVRVIKSVADNDFGDLHYIQADISSQPDRAKIVDFVKEEFGRLDLLVNNAGVAPKQRADILSTTEESFDRVLDINLKGPFFLTQTLANYMIEKKETGNLVAYNPQVINISSISAYTSSPNRGEYCISKSGISMMTKLYADRLAEYEIPVFEIRPGIIRTDMTAAVTHKYDMLFKEGITPMKRWGLPNDVAQAVLAIAEDRFPYSTGQIFDIDGGFHIHRL